ncbi:MAG: PrsW family intramembrane metalloprotease [Bacteroidetes bacterium]|nr:PrsW family intramembrane metalloprotease [Bacteroidota bacterium]MBU1114256.1 PrsW family intramembrane metalloprotease [Bacteroidota bacterium]MBU1797680.1 PrsW family intramembrane metalloprotease [Bacteroidota bacterium]
MLILLISGAFFPMLIYLYFLWKFDKNEPKYIKLVFYNFIYGATAAIILGIVGSKMLSLPLNIFFSDETINLIKIILIAPFVEEIAKALFLFKAIKNKNINDFTDGLIYGGAIGLGFGMIEYFFYFLLFSDSLSQLISIFVIKSSFSVVMHCLSTALVGGIISLTKYSSQIKLGISTIYALIIAMFIHFIWNISVIFKNTFFVGIIFIIIVFLLFTLTYYILFKYENNLIQKELAGKTSENSLNKYSAK